MCYTIRKMIGDVFMKFFRKSAVIILVLSLVISLIPLCVSAEEEYFYCGEKAISEMANSEALLYAYNQLIEGIENAQEEIMVYNGADPISQAEVEMVFDAYRNDHAEHFWLGNTYSMSLDDSTIYAIYPQYLFSGDELINAKAEFESAVSKILSGVKSSMTDYEKELYLHDAIAQKVVYVDSANSHSSYGALVEGKAVCEGYAEAFQVLLHRVGIRSYLVTGASINPSTNAPEGHEWNAVEIDGNFYYVDVTWDDQGDELYHAYFNIPKSVLTVDHALDELTYAMPQCNSDAMFYFNVEGGKFSELTVDGVVSTIDNYLQGNIYFEGGVNEFWSWLQANISSVAGGVGVNGGFSYGYSALGNEVHFYIKPSVEFVGATLDVGVDLTVKYHVSLSYGYENAFMRFTSKMGRVYEVEGVYDSESSYYVYAYTGINPQCMSDTIKAELVCNDLVIASKNDYSVKEYCNNLVASSASELNLTNDQFEKMKTLLADMLVYGAESQKYVKYNTKDLADSYSWVNEYKSTFNLPEYIKQVDKNTGDNKVKSVGVHMANVNKIYYKVTLLDENVKITVNGNEIEKSELTDNGDGTYTYLSDGLVATQFADVFEVKLFDSNDNEISTVKYNVNAYVNAKYDDALVGDLVKALSNYGVSATAYITADSDGDFDLGGDIV